ncbi:MAG TPA: hypothetical protein VMV77_11525 [Bacteroidales bacterium]|nr:hypothetical protein [Bacteroidales bacterium]
MRILISNLIIILLLVSFSCKPGPVEKDTFKPVFSTYKSDSTGKLIPEEKNEIFYGILTPVEVCAIFNRLGVPYDNAILNPISRRDEYLSSSKASINTGIYGVDFGYLKIFGIGQELIDYMVTIREMSNKLGIPDRFLTEPIRQIQGDMADPDTIAIIMNTAFYSMENHLRTEGKESTAGLMIMGGWVEALFIATQLLYDPDNPDPEVVQKIAEQKYTLTSLFSFLKNYYDDPVVVYYTKKLKFLQSYFDTFDIYFKKGDLEIDTTKQVLLSSGSEMTVTVETLNNIRDYVLKLRTEMVTP